MSKMRRLVAGIAIITAAAGLAAVAVVLLTFNRSTYPQRILADQAAEFLALGYDPVHVLPVAPVEIESGRTWITVTDGSGRIVASSALDRGLPVSLASCREAAQPLADCFFVPNGEVPKSLTVQLQNGSRQVLAVAPYAGKASGYVFAGRMTNQTDVRWIFNLRIVVSIWLSGIAVFLVANRLLSKK